MKFITFVSAAPGQPREEFQRWFSNEYASKLIRASPTIRGCLLRDACDPPSSLPPPPPSKDFAPYAVAMETWYSATEDFRREARPLEAGLLDLGAAYASYRVTPRLVKDPRTSEAGPRGARPQVTVVSSLKWLPGLAKDVAAQYWAEHGGVALRTQPIITKYEQNVVDEAISWSADTPLIDAYTDLSFKTMQDLESRFEVTDEELQDVHRFLHQAHTTFLGDARPIC